MNWSESEIDLLKKFQLLGMTASQIAYELRDYSRNAIIGKLHRLGFRVGSEKSKSRKDRKRKTKYIPQYPKLNGPQERHAPIVGDKREPLIHIARKNGVELVDLEFYHCRWPYDEGAEMYYCGRKKAENSSYCSYHHSRARV
jgi:GcrA cell cycle regulator